MKCPHCTVEIHYGPESDVLDTAKDGAWGLEYLTCPACDGFILVLVNGEAVYNKGTRFLEAIAVNGAKRYMIWPKASSRPPCPPEVPSDLAEDYNEACLVLADSPKASAALSRRCLQQLLRTKGNVKAGDLANEIQQVIDSKVLPSQLADEIDAIRNVGNFAAHPLKSKQTGEIVPVEPAEAEWNLEVLEGLFDFYFVQPAKAKKRREDLNAKLMEAGKPPMK